MAKYRKKPVVIEASEWHQLGDHPEVTPFRRPGRDLRIACEKCGMSKERHGEIDTLEGSHIVCPGDYIIRGVQGELYPCKPDIFAATYEPVDSRALSAHTPEEPDDD